MPEPTIEGVVKQEGRESTQVQSGPTIAGGTGERLVAGSGRLPGAWNPNENPSPDVNAFRAQQQLQQAINSKNKKEIKRNIAKLQGEIAVLREQIKTLLQEKTKSGNYKKTKLKLDQDVKQKNSEAQPFKHALRKLVENRVEQQLQIKDWLTGPQKTEGTTPGTQKTGRIETSDELLQKIENNSYLLKATEFTTPYIYNMTHLTDRFRLYNGDINEITMEGGRIKRGLDKGTGAANMMRILYPSVTGELGTGGGTEAPLKKDCAPTPDGGNYCTFVSI